MDGATGQSVYKQKSCDDSESANKKYVEESSIFCSTLVPLQLLVENRQVWLNPKPSSTRLCRPIRLQAAKETTGLITTEEKLIKGQIAQLQPTVVELRDGS